MIERNEYQSEQNLEMKEDVEEFPFQTIKFFQAFLGLQSLKMNDDYIFWWSYLNKFNLHFFSYPF